MTMPGPPFVIQGSEAPVFSGRTPTAQELYCSSCGHLLIENYFPQDYVEVNIECYACKSQTKTPSLNEGEVLATRTVTLGDKGGYFLGSTVFKDLGTIVTCDQAIGAALNSNAPKSVSGPWWLSDSGLNDLHTLYDELSGGKYAIQRKYLERKGEAELLRYPFVYGLEHIKDCLEAGRIDVSNPTTSTSIMWCHIFHHVMSIWRDHPRLRRVAGGLAKPKSFLHTCGQLLSAAYLFETGNQVGLSLENEEGKPNPDLYIRATSVSKLYIEAKAPEKLQWQRKNVSKAEVRKGVFDAVKRVQSQINSKYPGLLVIFSSLASDAFPTELKKAIRKALYERGRSHTSLAAVVGVSPKNFGISRNGGRYRLSGEFEFSVNLNKHYKGEPIVSA